MRQRRTDLALEAKELWEESARETGALRGVEAWSETREGFPIETVHILDQRGERALGKPAGRYVTLTMDGLLRREEDAFPRAARAVGRELGQLLDRSAPGGLALVVGLGNRAITPDAVGPKVHEHTLVTRHLVEGLPEHFGSLRPVASLSAGVLGTTGDGERRAGAGGVPGFETRLCHCGGRPGLPVSGAAVAGRCSCPTRESPPAPGWGTTGRRWTGRPWGCRCWRWGCPPWWRPPRWPPTCWARRTCPLWGRGGSCWSPPKDIDSQVDDLAKVIGYGISLALQPGLDVADLDLLLS